MHNTSEITSNDLYIIYIYIYIELKQIERPISVRHDICEPIRSLRFSGGFSIITENHLLKNAKMLHDRSISMLFALLALLYPV